MDITYYFNNKNIIGSNPSKYKELIQKYLTEKHLNLLEYTYLVNLSKDKELIINIRWFIEIINKINDDAFKKICCDTFPKIIKMETITKEIIPNTGDLLDKIIDHKKDIFIYTDDQKKAIKDVLDFIANHKEKSYGLYGYAGTGKTTLNVDIFFFLLKQNFIKSIAFSAPTNKAVNVIKGKIRNYVKELYELKYSEELSENFNVDDILEELIKINIKIEFITIHRLLKYKTDINTDGDRTFIRNGESSIKDYEIVLIDECSMISLQIITHIYEDIREYNKNIGDNYRKIPKIIFSGDKAQLPPVNETISSIFIKKANELSIKKFNEILGVKNSIVQLAESKIRYDKLISDILLMKSTTMKQVVRNKIDNVINLCYNVRQWVENEIKYPETNKYIGNGVYLYKNNTKVKKTDSVWFKNYIKKMTNLNKYNTSNIILTWTNRQSDEYNQAARSIMFSDKKDISKYEIGDILMLNDFYNIEEAKDQKHKPEKDNKNRFYTSEQIKVTNTEITLFKSPDFTSTQPKSIDKLKNVNHIMTKYKNIVMGLNSKTKRQYKIWILYVHRQMDVAIKDNIPEQYIIKTINDESVKLLEEEKKYASMIIKTFRTKIMTEFKEQSKYIDKFLIHQLWRDWNRIFSDPFAKVIYSSSCSIHKAQGSQFYNVFVDINDILNNPNTNEAKRCLYTALTRSANEIHLLV
jgi:hypothetical protein